MTSTILGTISEPVLEVVVYSFLIFGAVSLVALIAYAVYVFRSAYIAIRSITTVAKSMESLLDCCATAVIQLEAAINRSNLNERKAVEPASERSPLKCECGGTHAWPPVGSKITDTGAYLTLRCNACASTVDVPAPVRSI